MKRGLRNIVLSSVVIATGLLLFSAMLVGIFSLKQSAVNDHEVEMQAHLILENSHALNTLEWQAIASGKIEAGTMAKIEDRRTAIDETLGGMIRLHPDETRLAATRQVFDNYKKATDDEFVLISTGHIPEAVKIDEESTGPAFEQLVRLVTQVAVIYRETAESNNSFSSYLIVAISLLAVSIAGVLFLLYSSVIQKHRKVSMEKTVLELSEERFRSVAQSANEAIITINGRGKVTYWNSATTHMFGYKKNEALGQTVSFIIPERFREGYLAGMKRVTTTDQTKIIGRTVEFAGLKKDGSEFPLEISISRWQAQQGTFFTAIIRDITKRKQAEDQAASQSNALEQRHLQLAALYEIGSTISGTIELQELLDNALETILASGLLQMQHKAGILLVKDNKLTLVSHLGLPEEFLALHKEIASGECLCGMAMERGEIIISYDSSRDDRHTISYPGMEPHGHVIVPLKAMDRVVGVLYLYTPPGTNVDEDRKKLFATIGGQLGIAIENARLFEKTKELSLHDPLTGLANRSLMDIELKNNFAMARRTKRPLSLVMLDLDHFKKYNDTYGHPAGDKLLADIAAIITGMMRETDLVVRYGGEEFLIILPETDSSSAVQIAERIRTTIMQTGFLFTGNQQPGYITVSQGVATYDQTVEIDREDRILVMADGALYHAKRAGRNRVEVYRRHGGDATQP